MYVSRFVNCKQAFSFFITVTVVLRETLTFEQVCADHFLPSCLEQTKSYTDPRTGNMLEVSLPVLRLRPDSVPTVFPGCP